MNLKLRGHDWQVLWYWSLHMGRGVWTPTSPVFRWWQLGPVQVRRFLTWAEVSVLRKSNSAAPNVSQSSTHNESAPEGTAP